MTIGLLNSWVLENCTDSVYCSYWILTAVLFSGGYLVEKIQPYWNEKEIVKKTTLL